MSLQYLLSAYNEKKRKIQKKVSTVNDDERETKNEARKDIEQKKSVVSGCNTLFCQPTLKKKKT